MAMERGNARGAVRSEINVTPLVDVCLVLLIIFMVVTPLLQMGYSVSVPPQAGSPPTGPQLPQLVVTLTGAKQVYLNREPVSLDQLGLRLRTVIEKQAAPTVFFSASDHVVYGDAVQVLDLIQANGARRIGVMEEFIDPGAATAPAGL
jgi:biopolymer transport protein ExbD